MPTAAVSSFPAQTSNSSLLFTFLSWRFRCDRYGQHLSSGPASGVALFHQQYNNASSVLLLTRRSWHPPSDKRTRCTWEARCRLLWVVIFVRKSNKGACFGKSLSLLALSSHSRWPQSPKMAAVLALAVWLYESSLWIREIC